MINIKKNHEILIASDHAGFELKNQIINYYKNNLNFKDLGTDNNINSCDYPVIAEKLSILIQEKKYEFGMLICGSGIGMSIVANKFKNIRAALCYEPELSRLSRAHNNSNILCLGSRFTEFEKTIKIIDNFINTEFESGRHETRVNQILELENKY